MDATPEERARRGSLKLLQASEANYKYYIRYFNTSTEDY